MLKTKDFVLNIISGFECLNTEPSSSDVAQS